MTKRIGFGSLPRFGVGVTTVATRVRLGGGAALGGGAWVFLGRAAGKHGGGQLSASAGVAPGLAGPVGLLLQLRGSRSGFVRGFGLAGLFSLVDSLAMFLSNSARSSVGP